MTHDLSSFKGKDVILIGEGRDMLATADFLREHTEARSFTHRFFDPHKGESAYEQFGSPDLNQTVIIKTAGVPGSAVGAPYTTSTELFFKLIKPMGNTTIGVTGTKGKTTVASLIARMLEAAGKDVILCGNIGKAMITYLDEARPETIFVIELSSYQLDELRVSPHIACVTNLYYDHVDYHGSLDAYWESKHHIVEFMGPGDIFVYDPGFAKVAEWAKASKATTITIDANESLDMSSTKLIGDHNRVNAVMAKTVAMQAGASKEDCARALEGFEPVTHRLQTVRTVREVTFIDDAIASNPEAAVAGIEAVTKQVGPVGVMLLGGKDRGYDYHALMQKLADAKVPSLVFFPETTAKMKVAMPADYTPETFETENMDEAVQWAAAHAPKGSVVLLSNGAPSYSLWKDFEEKGDQFQAAVGKL
ncbi:MAG TPA: UDP-N-acetylmuramoyl-L-alanine--D-glutamate ligase [Candidatus Saccharimonadales bacterium]